MSSFSSAFAAPSLGGGAEADPATDRIIDAALEVFEQVGVRRSTIEDIARGAGVDRVTVYRRVGAKGDVVQAVIARETYRIFQRLVDTARAAESIDDWIVDAFTGVVHDLRHHAFFNRLMRLEAESTLPKVTLEAAAILRPAIGWAVDACSSYDASIVARDLPARIEMVARLVHSLVLAPQGAVDLKTPEQLARFARAYVLPILTH